MKFICGRPSCDQESSATLQIDAPSSTVSLVDPRVSRDGVPLCDRHAESTTAPLGWAMNDMRTRPGLKAVPDGEQVTVAKTPPRVRPAEGDQVESRNNVGSKMSKRQSIADRAAAEASKNGATGERNNGTRESRSDRKRRSQTERRRSSRQSRRTGVEAVTATSQIDDGQTNSDRLAARAKKTNERVDKRRSEKSVTDDGVQQPILPASGRQQSVSGETVPRVRPSRRREEVEEEVETEDKFPWLHRYEDDVPSELQASTPLLARAFRATGG